MVQEISIIVQYERLPDGCFVVKCDQITGFRLRGTNFEDLQRDLNPVVSDLLLHNHGFEVESIRWVPSPEDVRKHLEHPLPDGKATYVAALKVAA